MLSDLLTSSRGPGVIGTILALIVLLGFGGLMFAVTEHSKGPSLATKINEKEIEVQSLADQIGHWKEAAVVFKERRAQADLIERLKAKVKRRRADIERDKKLVEEVRGRIVAGQQQFEEYKAQYRLAERARAVGEELGVLTTKDGKVYERVKIKQVTALELRFSHKNGNTGVSYKQLPSELQDRFQFSEVDAKKMTKALKRRDQGMERGGERYRISKEILDKRPKLQRCRDKISSLTAENRRLSAEISSNQSAARAAMHSAASWRNKGNRGLNYDNAKKFERKADRLRKRSDIARRKIQSNRLSISKFQEDVRRMTSEISKLKRELETLHE